MALGWLDRSSGREVEKEASAEHRGQSGKRRRTSGSTSQRFLAWAQSLSVRLSWKCSFRLLVGPQNLSSLLPCSDKERRRLCQGKGKGASHDRWVVVKTLIAVFWDGSGFLSYLPIPNIKNPPPIVPLRHRARFKGKCKEARNSLALESCGAPS